MYGLPIIVVTLLMNLQTVQLDFQEDLTAITEEITKNYFSYSCIVYITDDAAHPYPEWTISSSSTVIININWTESITRLLGDIYDMDCRGLFVRVYDRSRLVEMLIKSYKKSKLSRYNNKRYLFMPKEDTDNDPSFLEGSYMYYMPDLLFISPQYNSSGFDLLSHNYFDGYKYDVQKKKYEVFDVWRSGVGLTNRINLYPDRLANLNGKLMTFGMMHYIPYTLVIKDGDDDDDVVYDGLETRIAVEYANSKNASWMGKDHPLYLWGDLFEENETGNGILGSVYEHKVDMGFSAIYQWHCDVLDCSYPYIYAGVTCLVPKPVQLSRWFTVILPFQPIVWVAVFTSYLLSSMFVFTITCLLRKMRHEKRLSLIKIFSESFFETFRVQLEQSNRTSGVPTPLYFFFRVWTVYCFFVTICWQGGIASYLTVPRFEDPISDAYELTARWPKVEWGGNHIDWVKSIEQTSEPVLLKIVKNFVVLDDETLRKRVRARNFGYFMERLPNGHYGLNDYIDEHAMNYLRIMENNVYTANCVMVLPKCSPYLQSLDKILFWMFDTGLIQKMEIQTSLEVINNRLQNIIRTSTEKETSDDAALLVDHILGAICIYVIGMSFSGMVFLFEFICYHRKISYIWLFLFRLRSNI